MQQFDTVAAIATPPGKGGIAVVRISGGDAYAVAAKVFLPHNKEKVVKNMKGYTAAYGSFVENEIVIDTGVAIFYRAPHSYTGEDTIELSCHGGEMVTRQLMQACLSAGAVPAPAGEFTKRAVLNGKMSLAQAEAVLGLIEATSEQAVAQANATLSGKFAQRMNAIKAILLDLAGHMAAFIDYPEEDVEEITLQQVQSKLTEVLLQLNQLAAEYGQGKIIRRGINTAIVGSPNVGKSTIFNLLLGNSRSIVTDIAGTTRDVVREEINLGGIVLHIADTAGLHNSNDIVEAEGIRRSYEEMQSAGLIIAVFDGSRKLTEEDILLAKKCTKVPSIAIINKEDLQLCFDYEQISKYFTKTLYISAQDPEAVRLIEKSVTKVLSVDAYDVNAGAITTERQYYALKRTIESIEEAIATVNNGLFLDVAGICIDNALQQLSELMGENYSEAIINNVFTNFCVGK